MHSHVSTQQSRPFGALLSIVLALTILATLAVSVDGEEVVEREVVVVFHEGVLEMPPGQTTAAMEDVQINSEEVSSVLEDYAIEQVNQPFPDFDPADTLRLLENGEVFILVNLKEDYVIRLAPGEDRNSLVDQLSELWEVRLVEPNSRCEFLMDPQDDYFYRQWALKNEGQGGGTAGEDIHACEAWDKFRGRAGVIIGIVDGGVDENHIDLDGRTIGDPGVAFSHGTGVAGVAGAETNNNEGIAGVDWHATVLDETINDLGDNNEIYKEVLEAIDHGADIINASWRVDGGYSFLVRGAFEYAYRLNRLPVAAIGNYGTSAVLYPAGHWIVMAIGATTNLGALADYSSYGGHIDVVAPGGMGGWGDPRGIYTTWPNDNYDFNSGTSLASPHVTGIAALLKGYSYQIDPDPANHLTNDDIAWVIKYSADDKGSPGWDQYYGYGRVNADSALTIVTLPYQYFHEAASGGSDYSSTGWYVMGFIHRIKEPNQAGWRVKRHDVRKTVSLPHTDFEMKHVWGRKETVGWSYGEVVQGKDWQFEEGWCRPVNITSTHVTLRTYVYEVQKINKYGSPYGDIEWWPRTPANVTYHYTVLGRRHMYVPSNLSGDPFEDRVELTWQDNTTNEAGFKIEIKGGAYPNWTELSPPAEKDETSYTVSEVERGTSYQFRIRAYAGNYASSYSDIVSCTVPWLNAPTNLTAVTVPPFQAKLSWTDNSSFTEAFEIWRGTSYNDLSLYVDGVTSLSYTDNGVNQSTWYYYQVRAYDMGHQHYSEFSNKVEVFTSTVKSVDPEVLSFNNGRKMVHRGGKLYLVYSGEEDDPGGTGPIYYRESMDGGRSWDAPANLGDGRHPAVAVSQAGVPCVVWEGPEGLMYAYKAGGIWYYQQLTDYYPSLEDSVPSIVVGQDEMAHIVWKTYKEYDPYVSDATVEYVTFPVTSPEDADYSRVRLAPGQCLYSPAIVVTPAGVPHVVWQEEGPQLVYKIYHSRYIDPSWTEPLAICDACPGQRHPAIALGPGETVYAVWEEAGAQVRLGEYDGTWTVETIADIQFPYVEVLPVVLYAQGAIYVVWNDAPLGYFDQIFYSRKKNPTDSWSPAQEWVETPWFSATPHIAFGGPPGVLNRYLYLVWNENRFGVLYYVGFRTMHLGPQDSSPTLSLNLGDETPTPYTVQRDGYVDHGPASYQTIDYATTALTYEISGLDPSSNYILGVEYYHEFPTAITQTLSMDAVGVQDTVVPPGELVYAEGVVPGTVLQDSTLLVRVIKSQGDFAVAGFLTLWEEVHTESPGGGGPQTAAAKGAFRSRVFSLSQCYPNPFTDATTIRYYIPHDARVSLKVFDASGRAVETLVDVPEKIGLHSIRWSADGLAAGVYFCRLEVDEFTATRKLALVR